MAGHERQYPLYLVLRPATCSERVLQQADRPAGTLSSDGIYEPEHLVLRRPAGCILHISDGDRIPVTHVEGQLLHLSPQERRVLFDRTAEQSQCSPLDLLAMLLRLSRRDLLQLRRLQTREGFHPALRLGRLLKVCTEPSRRLALLSAALVSLFRSGARLLPRTGRTLLSHQHYQAAPGAEFRQERGNPLLILLAEPLDALDDDHLPL